MYMTSSGVCSETYQTSKTARLGKIIGAFQQLITFANYSILDIWQRSECVSVARFN